MATGRIPGPLGLSNSLKPDSDYVDLCRLIVNGMHWLDTERTAVKLIGPYSFASGVAYGVGESIVSSVVELYELVKVFVLADLYDAMHDQTPLWLQITRDRATWPLRQLGSRMGEHLWGAAIREAKDERDTLVAGFKELIHHPIDAMVAMKNEYAKKWQAFEARLAEHSVHSRFQAGVIFGALLFDLIGLIAGGIGVARAIVVAVPKLAKLMVRMERAGAALVRRKVIKTNQASSATLPPPSSIGSTNSAIEPYSTAPKNRKKQEEHSSTNRPTVTLKTKPLNPYYAGEEIPNNPNAWYRLHGLEGPVRYLDDEERAARKLTIKDGKLYDAQGKPFDTSESRTFDDVPLAIFVMDEHGHIYASNVQIVGEFHHSSFLAGKPVAMAGEMQVENGVLRYMTNNSGHYKPDTTMLFDAKENLIGQGLSFSQATLQPM